MKWIWWVWLAGVTLSATAQEPYVFATFDVPGAALTNPAAINNAGTICGIYETTLYGAPHAFILDQAGKLTKFDAAGAAMTLISAINDSGTAVRYWSADLTGNVETGFIRNPSGTMTNFTAEGASDTAPAGINDLGEMVVSTLTEPGPGKAWFVNSAGVYNAITVAGASSINPEALDNSGQIAGSIQLMSNPSRQQGFIYDVAAAAIQIFTIPESTVNTVACGIKDAGDVAGYYTLGYGGEETSHGFVRMASGESFTSISRAQFRPRCAASMRAVT